MEGVLTSRKGYRMHSSSQALLSQKSWDKGKDFYDL